MKRRHATIIITAAIIGLFFILFKSSWEEKIQGAVFFDFATGECTKEFGDGAIQVDCPSEGHAVMYR